jgi:hypothetical protein
MYGILAVVGWVWTALVGTFLIIRLRHRDKNHEKHP